MFNYFFIIVLLYSLTLAFKFNHDDLREINKKARQASDIIEQALARANATGVTPEERFKEYRIVVSTHRSVFELFKAIYDKYEKRRDKSKIYRVLNSTLNTIDEMEKYNDRPVEVRLAEVNKVFQQIEVLKKKLQPIRELRELNIYDMQIFDKYMFFK
uniref:Uncharacterized protein n=1 Tax=Clastoptera arizonana TaxID=38151 RepID=A0A1B6EB16_9HEMI